MNDLIRGPLRSVNVVTPSGGGGTITVVLRPTTDEVWDLFHAQGRHDDAAGLACYWYTVDLETPTDAYLYGASSQPRYLFTDCPGMRGGLRISYRSYIKFVVVGMAAAKNITVTYLYERITSMPQLGGGP
jgi:hypothetical protein